MIVKDYVARIYQDIITNYIINKLRCGVWAGMGLGKTAATLNAITGLKLCGYLNGAVLVLAPYRVANKTWPDEIKKWKQFNHLTISPIIGDEDERRRALRKKADIYTINYENIPWLIDMLRKQEIEWFFEMVVADESTKLKSFRLQKGGKTGKRAKALAVVAHTKAKRFVELTGTPSPNGLKDLWGQLWFVDGGARLGRTYTAFMQRWFQRSFDGYGIEPLPHAQKEIEKLLADVCMSLNAKDYFDLKEPIRNIIKVSIPEKARAIYRDMEKKMYTEIEDIMKTHSIEAVNAAVKTMKCLQLANGAAYIDDTGEEWIEIHKAKLEALEDIIEEAAGMPVMVAYHFKSDLARLKKHFPQGKVLDKNPKTEDDWNAGKIPVMFAHPASAGHGLNLQYGSNILAFFSINWNLEDHLQIIERIGPVRQLQAGFERLVFLHYITVENTIEDLVLDRLESKRGVQEILMEALKHRKVTN